ncbi:hypothetical protein ASZ90_008869 [hydrocarbon metagenome]|uniref:Uncharacterized protein n=1 Tax=hydrocarbon metagenome TaxID=938273 RepID=A0A0W8FKE5_9ZZZZ
MKPHDALGPQAYRMKAGGAAHHPFHIKIETDSAMEASYPFD